MKSPTFLLQSDPYMQMEKIACRFSDYPTFSVKFQKLSHLPKSERVNFIPVGTVEFVKEYARIMDLQIPSGEFSYWNLGEPEFDKFFHRKIRKGIFSDADSEEFVKPMEIKIFTGEIKKNIKEKIIDTTPVWISEPVQFWAEFRFYIYDYVNRSEILGWSRYDDTDRSCPDPDIDLVKEITKYLRNIGAPGAYSVDIGWRPDLNKYCLVELNDAWSLGFYNNTDPQSKPPSYQNYADMLRYRWSQIVFCNII